MISYGGVTLGALNAELTEWIDDNVQPHDLYQFSDITWPGIRNTNWPWQYVKPPKVKLNTLHWPVGASRWAVGHFLATTSQLDAIRNQIVPISKVNPPSPAVVYKTLPLALSDGRVGYSTGGSIQTEMWMLPAVPVATALGFTNRSQRLPPLPGPATGQNASNLYIVTLVDDRYFWWQKPSSIVASTTWLRLYSAISSAIGKTISVDPIPTGYGPPNQSLQQTNEPLPMFLDAVAASCGQRIVRAFDGSVFAQNSRTALASVATQVARPFIKWSGGPLAVDTPFGDDLPITVPSSVIVSFSGRYPDNTQPPAGSDVYAKIVELSSLNLTEYANVKAYTGSPRMLRGTSWAEFEFDAVVPDNQIELDALATQMAKDWYLWQLGRLRQWFVGIVPWIPDGFHDICWEQTTDKITTMVDRVVFDDRVGVSFVVTGGSGFPPCLKMVMARTFR